VPRGDPRSPPVSSPQIQIPGRTRRLIGATPVVRQRTGRNHGQQATVRCPAQAALGTLAGALPHTRGQSRHRGEDLRDQDRRRALPRRHRARPAPRCLARPRAIPERDGRGLVPAVAQAALAVTDPVHGRVVRRADREVRPAPHRRGSAGGPVRAVPRRPVTDARGGVAGRAAAKRAVSQPDTQGLPGAVAGHGRGRARAVAAGQPVR
jgi:hypothetical protein